MRLLINIDVPDLSAAEALYTQAFGLAVGRRFGWCLLQFVNRGYDEIAT
ncbi:hypothetical protein [Pseudoxanthomonas sp.]|jgi:hypothetical protein